MISQPVLVATDISVRYGGTSALERFSGAVCAGEIVGLIGPNGAGKSTLLNALSGLVSVDEGAIALSGRRLEHLSFAARSRLGIGRTFQAPKFCKHLTLEEQFIPFVPGLRGAWVWGGNAAAQRRLRAQMEALDLLGVADRRPSSLTLGEQRRAEIARALLPGPQILLVDEPSSGMAAPETQTLAAILTEVKNSGCGVLLIEHNIPFVEALASRVIVIDAGRKIAEGPTDEILSSRVVREAYLGKRTAA